MSSTEPDGDITPALGAALAADSGPTPPEVLAAIDAALDALPQPPNRRERDRWRIVSRTAVSAAAPLIAAAERERLAGEGWLPSEEVKLKTWRAFNLTRGKCRWCGANRSWGNETPGGWKRDPSPLPHKPGCRFYDGPVTHEPVNGHFGTFDYWITCKCGRSYPQHDADDNEQDCPDKAITHRHPSEPDLTIVNAEAS